MGSHKCLSTVRYWVVVVVDDAGLHRDGVDGACALRLEVWKFEAAEVCRLDKLKCAYKH